VISFRCGRCGKWSIVDVDDTDEVECINCKIRAGVELIPLDIEFEDIGYIEECFYFLKEADNTWQKEKKHVRGWRNGLPYTKSEWNENE
jgi:hypothetical protein